MYQYILFDLDGTLTDPGLGITNSVAYALEKMGIPVPERSELYKFIGPPPSGFFLSVFRSLQGGERTGGNFLSGILPQEGIFENQVYPGIPELLLSCRKVGGR